ncbi:MAG: dockerin type I repeat-containing protein [Candidatus Zixiibacteriota bacterium]|nr:MAG: dockerin type I repeat-containing protein [candidate division Zixibacteria bacterium]
MKNKLPYAIALIFTLVCWLAGTSELCLGGGLKFYEFAMRNHPSSENFIAATSDTDVIARIEAQLALPENERYLHIHGLIDTGNAGYNYDWSWHFTENLWDIVEISIEICDGSPSYVEANLWYWLTYVEYFCPWSSYVLQEVPGYICGDANNDEVVNLSDILYLIDFIYASPPGMSPQPMDAGDANADGSINLLDILYFIHYLYGSPPGPEPLCP